MPYKSEAQRKYFYSQLPSLADEWERETPKGKKLPKKLATKKRKQNEKKKRKRKGS